MLRGANLEDSNEFSLQNSFENARGLADLPKVDVKNRDDSLLIIPINFPGREWNLDYRERSHHSHCAMADLGAIECVLTGR